MENIKEWVIALCACSALVSLAQTLLPDTSVKKAVNLVLSLITAACFIEPISMIGDIRLDIEPIEAYTYTDQFDAVTLEEFENRLRMMTESVLHDIGVTAREIDVKADIDGGEVKMRITVDERYKERIGEIESAVFTQLGIDADIRCAWSSEENR